MESAATALVEWFTAMGQSFVKETNTVVTCYFTSSEALGRVKEMLERRVNETHMMKRHGKISRKSLSLT